MNGIILEMRRVVTTITNDEQQANAVVYALIRNFGGERLYIPHNDYQIRNEEMICLYQAGASLEQLASRYRLAVTTINRILKANGKNHDPQNRRDADKIN